MEIQLSALSKRLTEIRERIEKPSDALSIGQEIEAKVVDLNEADKKISLSIKALLNDNEAQEEAPATEE